MNKRFAKYMKCGKKVESLYTGCEFKLIEDMSAEKDTVKAVNLDKWQRYDLLRNWIQNWEKNCYNFRERFDGNIEDCKKEMEGYEEELLISAVKPANRVSFITSGYQTKFEVLDLSNVSVNGKVARVNYTDDYHFSFVEGGCGWRAFHICQFAEICEETGMVVRQLDGHW